MSFSAREASISGVMKGSGGGPGRATEILVTYIYKLGFVQTRFDYAAAVTVVFFVFLIAVAWAANRLSGGNAGARDME